MRVNHKYTKLNDSDIVHNLIDPMTDQETDQEIDQARVSTTDSTTDSTGSNFFLKTKTIKKIYIKGNQTIEIKKGLGLSMVVESNDPILCKIENSTLYISPCPKKSFWTKFKDFFGLYGLSCFSSICNLCCFVNYLENNEPHLKNTFNKKWNIDALFIIKHINYLGSGTFTINEGYDKSVTCIKSGKNGMILIKKLNVVDFKCKVLGNGNMKAMDSSCSNFIGEINGNGKIKTPKVFLNLSCKIQGKGIISSTVSKKCYIYKNISEFGTLTVHTIE